MVFRIVVWPALNRCVPDPVRHRWNVAYRGSKNSDARCDGCWEHNLTRMRSKIFGKLMLHDSTFEDHLHVYPTYSNFIVWWRLFLDTHFFCRCNWPTSNFVNSIADSPTTSRRDFPKIWHQFGILYKAAPRRLQLCSCQKKHILCMHMQYTPRESCMHVHGTVYDNWWCWRSYACVIVMFTKRQFIGCSWRQFPASMATFCLHMQ
jgi:hypothetical protein